MFRDEVVTPDELHRKVRQIAAKAVEADSNKDYEEAIRYYLDAAEKLISLIKITKHEKAKNSYKKAAAGYTARVKEIRDKLEGKGKKKERETEENKDKSELQRVIEDTIVSMDLGVSLDMVAGLSDVKKALREAIILPLKRPDLFTGARKPWKGILLFGPPGCGKTMIAKATAGDVEATFFNISAASLVSKYLGESEKLVKILYDEARERQPSIIFIDEVDALTQARGSGSEHDSMRRVKTQLLTSMEGLGSTRTDRIVTIGATNIPWEIDSAFRRRFERRIYVPVPDIEARTKVFEINSKGISLADDVNFQALAELTEGFSGSDIANVCREAIFAPVRELDSSGALDNDEIKARDVRQKDYIDALKNVNPSVSENELVKFDDWEGEYGAG